MLGKVFKAYDVRSTFPKPLSPKLAWQIGYGTAQYLTAEAAEAGHDEPMMRHIVVGRDMRKSSPELTAALTQGMRDFGASVIDVGRVDTPFVYFAINYLGCCGGVQVTASHNPANYNGFKISKIHARPVGMDTGLDEIRRNAAMASADKVTPAGGRMEERDLWPEYRAHVRRFLDPQLVAGTRTLKVVVDASNGMAGTMVPKVFDDIAGLELIKLNFDNSTGEFVHEPNPLVAANLAQLREAVLEQNADAGICFDGDADRCMVVDEKAQLIGCDLLTAWLSRRFLDENAGSPIVYDLRSSRSLPEIITESGGTPIKSRVGHVFMKEKLREHGAVFGGELSGHFYFRDNFFADSGAIAFACVLSALAESGDPLSTAIAPARRYAQSGEINFETEDKELALSDLKRAFPHARVEELDGVTLSQDDWWCNVRASNTEPLLRLNLEGKDDTEVERLVDEVAQYLGERVEE
ncbi:MAG: phosphomannomutase/phosphoglucomutase [Phycisphaerales bacterium]|nr:phosphomannomutase/phosphoglucomutase [Phycisphaerae bacterium]NNF42846.1 phosphomannomutase/phosphoglucomutase [Phycisphaerales bacterium]NNM24964.1 phosphomannomutase/phosphoglucomutase [Phycisphaerales bacterium]